MKKIYFVLFTLFTSVSFSQNYEIYVSDAGNFNNPPWQILKFASDGSNPQVFINTNLGWPQDILFLESKNEVLISNLTTNTITRYNAATGLYINNFATGISGPTRMKIGADSLIYVLQWSGNGKVLRYDQNGMFVGEFTAIGVPAAIGLDWDNMGNLYVSSYTGNTVYKFDSAGNNPGIFISSNLSGPTNVWVDDNNNLFVVEFNGGKVKQFDNAGNFLLEFITGLSQPEGVAFLPSGNILIGDGGTSSVKEYAPNGNFISTLIPGGAGNLLQPNAVVLRTTGGTSVTEYFNEFISVNPSIGTTFYIDDYDKIIMSIKIYSILGLHVDEISNSIGWVWNAGRYPDGFYLINISLKNGKNIFKKIVVKRD